MKLTDEQKQTLSQWVADGLSLSEIQARLDQELGLKLTFMETRFLVDDLGLDLVSKEAPPSADAGAGANPDAGSEAPPADAEPTEAEAELVGGPGEVSVSVDRITQPGAMVSGSVTFSDGKAATWALDQRGRLVLQSGDKGYQPPQEDLEAFQRELTRELERSGF